MSSVRSTVVRGSVAVLIGTLAAVGAATAGGLHAQRVRDLDQALLAAAQGGPGGLELEHARSPVEVWIPDPDEVPIDLWRTAAETERPVWSDAGDERLLLVVGEDEREDRDVIVAAAAPRPTFARSAGPFLVVYSAVSALTALGAAAALSVIVGRAFRPLERSRRDADRVVGLGQGARLSEDGPDEVRSLLRAMNAVLDRLDDAYAAQARFTAEAAHELRTPVTVMLGELDVALRRPRPVEAYADVLRSTREEVERIRDIVEGLLALARIDAGQAEALREPVRLSEIVGSVALREGGRLDVQQDPEVRVHRALVEVALGNLVRNARVHADTDVQIAVRADGGVARVEVADRGPGVPDKEAVFDRFVRSREKAGLGLGLPIAREVARRHGGDCVLRDRPGGGTVAVLTLPSAG